VLAGVIFGVVSTFTSDMSHQQAEPDALELVGQLARARRGALAALARAEGLAPEDAVDAVQEGLSIFLDRLRDAGARHDRQCVQLVLRRAARDCLARVVLEHDALAIDRANGREDLAQRARMNELRRAVAVRKKWRRHAHEESAPARPVLESRAAAQSASRGGAG